MGKSFNMNKKRGEITTQQIVLLIILIISFVVILFLLFRMDFFEQSDSEICHNSVVLRGTKLPNAVTPLNCHRAYVCISKDGSCERMTKPDVKKVKTEEEVYEVLAEEMANCWWMFGEGKINYVDPTWRKKNYCSICTQFVLDDSVSEIEGIGETISQDKLYEYLSKTTMPEGDETYASYLLGTSDVGRLKRELSRLAGTDVGFGEIQLGKQYFIVMGITSEVNEYTWFLGGAAIGAVGVISLATGGIAPALASAIFVGEVAGGAAGGAGLVISDLLSPKIGAIVVKGDGINNEFMAPTIQEANSDEFTLLNCDEIVTST